MLGLHYSHFCPRRARKCLNGQGSRSRPGSKPKANPRRAVNAPVPKNVPQHSLRRLCDVDLVLRMDYGEYRVHDDAFAEWVRNRELEG